MRLLYSGSLLLLVLLLCSCNKEDTTPQIQPPTTYSFARDNTNTVSFTGQTDRIRMAEELIGALKDPMTEEATLLEMYTNQTAGGGDANPFQSAALNASTKSIRDKVAASADLFANNTTQAIGVKDQFTAWMTNQVNEVYPRWNELASAGVAGQIADGSSVRYINALGLEYDQLVNKGLIGALMVDQMLNNYLSPAVLDAGTNRADNDAGITASGQAYTTMEHKWDEAYGYLFGNSPNAADPRPTIGGDDSFLNKYLGRVENDPDFTGMAQQIFDAFKLGRAAIVAGEYQLRDEQAALIRELVSEIIGIRAVYYLQQAKASLVSNPGGAFHDLSEGYGFIYSLAFTRRPDSTQPYLDLETVEQLLSDLLDDGAHGLWDVQPATLDAISQAIADQFSFTVAQAAE